MANILQTIKYSRLLNISCFHTTCINNNKAMKKIMTGNKKKQKYFETPILQSPSTFIRGSTEGKKSENFKRVTILNKLFMRHITDLMATRSELLGQRIEINKVEVSPDFQTIKVFWLGRGTESDEYIDEILQSHAGGLRHELSQLRVMGVVPKIRFVKDKQFSQIMEVDLRLSTADFGEDYIPVESTSRLKTELHLNTRLGSNIIKTIEKLEYEEPIEKLEYEEHFPDMPQNVLGLNHLDILEKVRKLLHKSQALHRLENISKLSEEMPYSINNHPLKFSSMKTQRQAFKDFLSKRQLLKAKSSKEKKYNKPELDYFEELESLKKEYQEFNELDPFLDDKDTYIEDDTKLLH